MNSTLNPLKVALGALSREAVLSALLLLLDKSLEKLS